MRQSVQSGSAIQFADGQPVSDAANNRRSNGTHAIFGSQGVAHLQQLVALLSQPQTGAALGQLADIVNRYAGCPEPAQVPLEPHSAVKREP